MSLRLPSSTSPLQVPTSKQYSGHTVTDGNSNLEDIRLENMPFCNRNISDHEIMEFGPMRSKSGKRVDVATELQKDMRTATNAIDIPST